nr:MAG TPA: hypothetical protein [Caudoviricetes sp.]
MSNMLNEKRKERKDVWLDSGSCCSDCKYISNCVRTQR